MYDYVSVNHFKIKDRILELKGAKIKIKSLMSQVINSENNLAQCYTQAHPTISRTPQPYHHSHSLQHT